MKYGKATVVTSLLPQICEELSSQFEEIEACALHGALEQIRACGSYSDLIYADLWNQLSLPNTNFAVASCPKRGEWFDACIRRFRKSLRTPKERYLGAPGKDASNVDCASDDGLCSLRLDQVVYQRWWGIEIYSDNAKLDASIAANCLSGSLNRLRSDLTSVNRWCADWSHASKVLQTLTFTEDRLGNLFEYLVLGILNEHRANASPASLYKDVREWTDIVVHNWSGVRIQAKFLRSVTQNDELLASHYRAKSTIVVSPVELARYLETMADAQVNSHEWAEFLRRLPGKPSCLDELARSYPRTLDKSNNEQPR